jgi:hypothetical protein
MSTHLIIKCPEGASYEELEKAEKIVKEYLEAIEEGKSAAIILPPKWEIIGEVSDVWWGKTYYETGKIYCEGDLVGGRD